MKLTIQWLYDADLLPKVYRVTGRTTTMLRVFSFSHG